MKKEKKHWNFRVVTKLYTVGDETDRIFSIAEVYYTDGKPDSYVEPGRILDGLESIKSLKWTNKKVKKAFKKSVLDLDNWPNEWWPFAE